MNPENAIEVKNVKKKFKVYMDKSNSMKEKMLFRSRNRYEDRWVLKGISFEVKKGEAIGLIGKNGCGKSTTLKMLTRIMYPTEGSIELKGRVSSLIELGAGFHPDMSGRENIFTNASIFGLTRKEVDERLEDIIRFSELEEYIDNPVRTYSSGMYTRLAFAVAINVDADVLLIDEILAVGDAAFQKKCFEKLKEIKKNGTTIAIVSHSMEQIYKICDRLIWIEDGLIREEGTPKFVGEAYLAAMEGRRLERIDFEKQKKKEMLERKIKEEQERVYREREKEKKRKEALQKMEREQRQIEKNETLKSVCRFCHQGARRLGNGDIHYTQVAILDREGKETNKLLTGDMYTVLLEYEAKEAGMHTKFVIGITRTDGTYCYGTSVNMNEEKSTKLMKKGKVKFEFCNQLLKGDYLLDLWINTSDGIEYDSIYGLMQFEVDTIPYQERGIFSMEHKWNVDGNEYIF